MKSIILVLIGIGLLILNHYAGHKYGQTCPKCGRKAPRQGRMIETRSGKAVYSYKCQCGETWNSYN